MSFLPPPQVEAIGWCCCYHLCCPRLRWWPPYYQAAIHFSPWAGISVPLLPCLDLGRWYWWAGNRQTPWLCVTVGLTPGEGGSAASIAAPSLQLKERDRTTGKPQLQGDLPKAHPALKGKGSCVYKAATDTLVMVHLQRACDVAIDERQAKAALSLWVLICACTADGKGGPVSCTELEHTGFCWGCSSYHSDNSWWSNVNHCSDLQWAPESWRRLTHKAKGVTACKPGLRVQWEDTWPKPDRWHLPLLSVCWQCIRIPDSWSICTGPANITWGILETKGYPLKYHGCQSTLSSNYCVISCSFLFGCHVL